MPSRVRHNLLDLLRNPEGLVLVTGPTGSGKTTTLYAALTHLNDGKRKVLTVEDPAADERDFMELISEDSLEVLGDAKVEPGLGTAKPGDFFQFMRQGYFCIDSKDSSADRLVFNRTVTLKDSWAKLEKKLKK